MGDRLWSGKPALDHVGLTVQKTWVLCYGLDQMLIIKSASTETEPLEIMECV